MTKNNKRMAFATLVDTTDSIDVTFFPETYKQHAEQITEDATLQVDGKLQKRDGEWNLLIDDLKPLT